MEKEITLQAIVQGVKDTLLGDIRAIVKEVVREEVREIVKEEVRREVAEQFAAFKIEVFKKIEDEIDGLSQRIQRQFLEYQDTLGNHERRIVSLEAKTLGV